jgi:CheY-like chemotaxis protein
VVNSGAQALAAVGTFRPEAVLLDIGLPGMDGYEVADRLCRQVTMTVVAIIARSGYSKEEAARRKARTRNQRRRCAKRAPPRVQARDRSELRR